MSARTLLLSLLSIVTLHVVLASWYASVTPWRTAGAVLLNSSRTHIDVEQDIGAPDERQHVNYVFRLVNGEGFPVFTPGAPDLYETYQSHQPPVFYLLAAGWAKATMAFSDTRPTDPRSSLTAGFKLRFLNVLLGAATVIGVFFLVFWGLLSEPLSPRERVMGAERPGNGEGLQPDKGDCLPAPQIALAAAAFAALLPMFLALCGAVSNDVLLICLCTWVLALCARAIRRGWTWKQVILTGALTGLALLTKTTAIALFPALLAAALVPQTKKPSVAMAAALVGISLLLVGPWWMRNQSLYGDPLAMKAFTNAFQGTAQKQGMVGMIAASGDTSPELTYWKDWVGWWTARSFFGVFGYMDIWLNDSGRAVSSADKNVLYRLLLVGFLVAALGWLLAASKPPAKSFAPVQIVNGIFLAFIVLLFLRFNMQYFQAQARYLLPALGPIACGLGIGTAFLLRKAGSWSAPILIGIVFLGVNAYALSLLPGEFQKRQQIGKQASAIENLPRA